jgi:glucose-6-phosphate 1-epimerase
MMAALHTYLRVGEVEQVRLSGLGGGRYEDFVTGTMRTDTDDSVRIGSETDRIYYGVCSPLELADGERRLRIEAANFPEVVVWNPWAAKASAMADLAPGDFRRFLCVEAALIGEPVSVGPGEQWWGRQTLIAG